MLAFGTIANRCWKQTQEEDLHSRRIEGPLHPIIHTPPTATAAAYSEPSSRAGRRRVRRRRPARSAPLLFLPAAAFPFAPSNRATARRPCRAPPVYPSGLLAPRETSGACSVVDVGVTSTVRGGGAGAGCGVGSARRTSVPPPAPSTPATSSRFFGGDCFFALVVSAARTHTYARMRP